MKVIRLAVATATGVSLLFAGHAGAAAKLPCKLITDGAADAVPINSERLHDAVVAAGTLPVGGPPPVPAFPMVKQGSSADTLDITSADVVADKKWVTAAIRVKKLAITAPAAAPSGITWFMTFNADNTDFTFAAHTDPTGAQYFDAAYSSTAGGSLYNGGPIGKLDLAKNEVRISVPIDLMAAQATIKPGLKITNIRAGTANEIAVFNKTDQVFSGGLFEYAPVLTDVATTPKPYVVGAKNCVTPGK